MSSLVNKVVMVVAIIMGLSACSTVGNLLEKSKEGFVSEITESRFSTPTESFEDLQALPLPKGVMTAAVYSFRDQTGQYKSTATGSSFSTAVTQGASSVLVQALKSSRWFLPVEREGLQNILTERKIIRAAQKDKNVELPALKTAQILFEGGIVGYNSNIKTGGLGGAYFGTDVSEQFREDQITVYLRAIDIRSGIILASISTTKAVYSQQVSGGFFRYISFKKLAEAEIGYSRNEPVMIATRQAIEKAVTGLIVKGIRDKVWSLQTPEDINHPVIKSYLEELFG